MLGDNHNIRSYWFEIFTNQFELRKMVFNILFNIWGLICVSLKKVHYVFNLMHLFNYFIDFSQIILCIIKITWVQTKYQKLIWLLKWILVLIFKQQREWFFLIVFITTAEVWKQFTSDMLSCHTYLPMRSLYHCYLAELIL